MTRVRCAVLLLAGLCLAGPAAQLTPAWGQVPGGPVTLSTPGGDVTVVADRLEQIGPDNLLIATGNAEVTRGATRLLADRVEINRDTGDAIARGRVIFYDGPDRITGERIDYNLRTGTGVVYEGQAEAPPYYRIGGERMERFDESRYRIRRGIFTTCEDDPPAWSFHFGSATADLEQSVFGTNASFWVKRFPILPWIPFFAAAIRQERQTGFLFPRVGSSTRKGLMAEVPFYWAISDSQDATIVLDAYEKKGVGLSAEYRYLLSATQRGSIHGFFIHESEVKNDDRGWYSVRHDGILGPGMAVKADVNGVSDDLVFRDYAERLQDRAAQRVESNVFFTKTWRTWNLVGNLFWYQDLTTTRPVELNRLPDISLQAVRQPVPGVPGLLYELDSSATRFWRQVGSEGDRVDIHPRLSYPVPVFGYFTVTPFVGGRMTGYDRRVLGIAAGRDGIPIEDTEDELRVRRLVELGSDFETRASRVYVLNGLGGLDAIQHAIEPRVNYTWIQGLAMDRIPQWTPTIDTIHRTSLISYALTNRIRARAEGPDGARWEAVRFTVGSSYDLLRPSRPFGLVAGDLILDSGRWARFRGDVAVDPYGTTFETGNTDLSVVLAPVTASVGTRFNKVADVNFLQGGLSAELTRHLVGRFSTNWDLRTDTFVENRFGVDLRYQCWAFSVDFVSRNRNENELRFALNLLGVGPPITTGVGLGALSSGGGGAK